MHILQALFCTLVGLLAPVYMLAFVWLIRWDATPSYADGKGPTQWDNSYIKRGDLPRWLRWAQTIDMRYPGGLYEPAIAAAYGAGPYWRQLWASYLWTGIRNRAHGLAAMLGKRSTDYIPDPFSADRDRTGWSNAGNVWTFTRPADGVTQTWRKLGPLYLVSGHQTYRLADGTFWAVPVVTLKRCGQA